MHFSPRSVVLVLKRPRAESSVLRKTASTRNAVRVLALFKDNREVFPSNTAIRTAVLERRGRKKPNLA
jgi:hypothetical protein